MRDIEFIYLNQADVRATGVDMALAIEAVEDAFRLHYRGRTNLPYKTVLDLGERERGRGNAMPGLCRGRLRCVRHQVDRRISQESCTARATPGYRSIYPERLLERGPPGSDGLYPAQRHEDRAVTGVGAKYLARKDSESVAMIGAGVQARTQLEALLTVVPGIREVRAYDLRLETAEQFAGEMSEKFSLSARAVENAEAAVRGADIIVTVTVADEPIVREAWMEPGSFFAAVGSYQEEEFEVITNSDKVVVDGLDHVLHRETPVIALMVEQGKIRKDEIIEIGQIVTGEVAGRTSPEERIFFSPIGMAIEDVCLCYKAYQLAVEKGIGTRLGLFGTST